MSVDLHRSLESNASMGGEQWMRRQVRHTATRCQIRHRFIAFDVCGKYTGALINSLSTIGLYIKGHVGERMVLVRYL